jgi:hypothetical protein
LCQLPGSSRSHLSIDIKLPHCSNDSKNPLRQAVKAGSFCGRVLDSISYLGGHAAGRCRGGEAPRLCLPSRVDAAQPGIVHRTRAEQPQQ